jgi:hypothetical protein
MFPKFLFYAKESAVSFPSFILFSNMSFQAEFTMVFDELQKNFEQFKKECLSRLDVLETKTKILEQSIQKIETAMKDVNYLNCSEILESSKRSNSSEILESSKRSKNLFFRVQKVANSFGVFTQFHVFGTIAEIHKELEEFGVGFWNEFNNSWDFYYEPQIYNRVLSLLKSNSDHVLEI